MLDGFRGSLRIPARVATVARIKIVANATEEKAVMSDLQPRAELKEAAKDQKAEGAGNGGLWLDNARKMIPGEALAGYLSLQPILKIAHDPKSVQIVLALAFLLVTIVLRWIGSQDPGSPKPGNTSQKGLVALSAATYIGLVYATGGQIFWHATILDSQLYGQIFTLALGIAGTALYRPA